MISSHAPVGVEELAQIVQSSARVIALGAGTKPRLGRVEPSFLPIRLERLTGVVEYQPDEYTITALAGTPLLDLEKTLGEHGQHLPFDPFLVQSGATLGGTVASGLSGPGRFRYGGIRDFILGVRFVDGLGRVLRVGAKVVKNAAGFDLPKFLTGSLGRFGILAEVTLKVFPRRSCSATLRIETRTLEQSIEVLTGAGQSRWDIESADMLPDQEGVFLRLAGPEAALSLLAQEVLARWPGQLVAPAEADRLWADHREFRWTNPGEVLAKVPLTPTQVSVLCECLKPLGGRAHISSGGSVAYVSVPESGAPDLEAALSQAELCGLTLRGCSPLRLGIWKHTEIAQRVKAALDPQRRFPGLEDC